MKVEIKITPDLDSHYSYPNDIIFSISDYHITLEIEGREIVFLKTDFEKLIKISKI